MLDLIFLILNYVHSTCIYIYYRKTALHNSKIAPDRESLNHTPFHNLLTPQLITVAMATVHCESIFVTKKQQGVTMAEKLLLLLLLLLANKV